MRFCPFCAQENPDDARECGHCGKRLPPPRTAPPRVAPAPPVAERPKKEIPARPAPRSMPLKGQEPLADRPEGVPHPIESPADTAPAALPSMPGARPVAHMPQTDTEAPTLQGDSKVPTLTPPPPPKPGHKTVLGIGAYDPPTAPSIKVPPPGAPRPSTQPGLQPMGPQDSERRETKPLSVESAASAAKQQQKTTAPKGVSAHAPTLAAPAKPAPAKTTVGRPKPTGFDEDAATTVDPHAPKNPLPPPAETHPLLKPSPSELGGDTDENAPNQPMEGGHTPVLPTMALPPMPPPPRGGKIVDSVMYLLPLAKAIWARKKAQDNIRALLHGDQKLLDQVLRDLGRAAREAKLDVPAVAEEMRRVRAEEDRRGNADKQIMELEENREKELQRWGAEDAERNQELNEKETAIRTAEEELRKKGDERRVHDAERAKIDAQIRALEKKAAQEDARAAKADVTPPEKGGGPNTAANARAAADSARKEATGLIPSRDIARAKVEALDGPIGQLTKQVVDGRAALGLKRKELTEAQASHKRTLAQFETDKRRCEAEREGAEREMSQRFVAAGTLLNLNRVQDNRFQSLYDRIDELKAGVNAREAAIVRLEGERRGYDRPAVQKGLLAIGIAAGAVILLMIILIIVLGRH